MRVWSKLKNRIVVGITGASGVILGIKLLKFLKKTGIETHLIITGVAKKIIEHETDYSVKDVEKLADSVYDNKDLFAPIASGSFKIKGMVVIPCSMKTLAGVANGYSDNLLLRVADVCLKERRRMILVAREMPLSQIHVENMERVSRAGGIILPPVLTFYSKPKNINDMVNHVIGKVLDMLDIENDVYKRWGK
ncbi:MAG: UbiX family flavin prenyltransferase [Candidatus Aenigmarchaeota archaeon]|nr:UbiX family flavin prenyltransferase [Candidatus Aenigmarchaeota archaeon]